jgi:hypothetical protein
MFQTLMRSTYTFRSVLTRYTMSPLRKVTKLYYSSIKTKEVWGVHSVACTEFYGNKMGKKGKNDCA